MRWQEEVARDLGFTVVLHLVYYGVPYLVFRFGKPKCDPSSQRVADDSQSRFADSRSARNSKNLLVGGAVLAYTSAPLLISLSPRFPPYIKLMVCYLYLFNYFSDCLFHR